jgi:hypothetical protein
MKKYLVGAVLIVSLTVGLSACAWQTTVNSILSGLPTIAEAVIAILQVSGVSVPTNTQATIVKDDAAAIALVKSTEGVGGQGALCDAKAAVHLVENDMSTLFELANVSNSATQAKVLEIATVVVAGADTVFSLIPAAQGCPASAELLSNKYRSANQKKYTSVDQFVADYNSALTSKTGDEALDSLTKKHKLHYHSVLIRYASFGIKK